MGHIQYHKYQGDDREMMVEDEDNVHHIDLDESRRNY